MGSLRFVPILLLLASPALAQTYGIGRAPTAAELAASSITISPTGVGLPKGHGNAAEGAKLFIEKGCSRLSRRCRRRRRDGGAQFVGEKRPRKLTPGIG